MTDANRILSSIKVSEKRLKHTMGVADCAKELAKTHFPWLDLKQVELAALMHDYTKEYPFETQFELCAKYGIELSDEEKIAPKLLHGKTASAIAQEYFGLSSDACSAIYWHTTGRANMTPFEIVIYLADYIEEFRDDPACVKLREHYQKNLKRNCDKETVLLSTLVRSFDTTLKHLIDKGNTIDRNTIEARNFYLKQLNERI